MRAPIVVGAVAYDAKVVPIWEGIRDFFRERDVPLEYVLYSNYEAQVDALFRRHVEIAWNTNVAWVRAQKRADGRARALAMRDTDVGFTSKLVVRAGLDARGPADLRGSRIALGSADSGQAAILPVHFLAREGLVEGRDFRSLRFDLDVGKHGDTGTSELEVVRAIVEGQADAGFLGDTTWARLVAERAVDPARIKAVWTSPPYAHCNFTALPDLSAERAEAFTRTLLGMEYNDPRTRTLMDLEGLKAWVPGRTDGYAVLEEAMRQQGLL